MSWQATRPKSGHARWSATMFATLLFASPDASAAAGTSFEGVLLTFLAVGVGFWLAFATIPRFRRGLQNIPGEPGRLGLLIMGAIVLAFAAGSAMLGKTWMGGGVIIEAHEPLWFWNVVKFHLGVGCVLVLFGLLSGGRSR